MYRKPHWSREGLDWPLRDASQFIPAGGIKWHYQTLGEGPVLLLLHGTGAATHSWHKMLPLLATKYTILAIDLPGHGFTETPQGDGLSLPGMAYLISALLFKLDITPYAIIGHSAGAPLGAEMILSNHVQISHLIAINGAFKPFDGVAAHLFPVIAKAIALNPLTIFALASRGGDTARIGRLMEGTGSKLDAQSIELYARLFATPGHIAGVMGMMARWELGKLAPRLPFLTTPTTFIAGTNDLTISPRVSSDYAKIIPNAQLVTLAGLGHLAHEEAPETVARSILAALA